MKKRISAILLVVITLLALVLTSCGSDSEAITGDEPRRALTMTLYCITDKETTAEAIQEVENAINRITMRRFSTKIVLRYFTADEYEQKIDSLVADIALEQKEKEIAESEAADSAKESRRIAAIDKLVKADKADVTTRKLIIWSTDPVADITEEEAVETVKNELGVNVEKYPEVTDTQLDIFLIPGIENLYKYVKDETYATDDESFLVKMDEYLGLGAKSIRQYVTPTVLQAGKVDGAQYAIPTNKRAGSDSTYLVLDKELVEKYGFNADDIKNLTSSQTNKLVDYLRALKENEPEVAPLYAASDAPGLVTLFGDERSIFGAFVSNNATTGSMATPKNLLSLSQFTDNIIAMEQYKRNGYILDNVSDDTRWGAKVVKASVEEIANYDPDKYIVKVLAKGLATTDSIGQYMFGISKYTKDASRCMEIITYITTNSEFRNLFQYGIEGKNYYIDEESGKLVRLNNSYMMDIYATGNTFIAYPEEYMELDQWQKDIEANKDVSVSPYLGFTYENDNNHELVEKMKKLSDDTLQKISEFSAEKAKADKIADLNNQIEQNLAEAAKYKELLDEVSGKAQSYVKQIDAANAALAPYEEAYNKAKAEYKPYEQKINALRKQIETAKKKLDKPEEDTDVEALKAEIEALELDLREQLGYSYEIRKVYNAAKADYDRYNAVVTELEKAYKDEKVTSVDSEGNTKENSLKTVYEARNKNYNDFLAKADKLKEELAAMEIPSQAEVDAKYAALLKTVEENSAELEKITADLSRLNVEAKPYNDAVKTAKSEAENAKEILSQKEEALHPFKRESAIALSYIEDKENEIEAEKSDSKKEALKAELESLKAAYAETLEKAKPAQDEYDAALADYEAKLAAVETAENADVLVAINEKTELRQTVDTVLKKALSDRDNFKTELYQYEDEIVKKLYTEFFKGLLNEMETENDDYKIFMNVGDEADNPDGVIQSYTEWFKSAYGG